MRVIGLEPTCLTASDPKSDTSANFATPALRRKAQGLKPKALSERENRDFWRMDYRVWPILALRLKP